MSQFNVGCVKSGRTWQRCLAIGSFVVRRTFAPAIVISDRSHGGAIVLTRLTHCRLHCMGFSCNWLLHNHWRIRTRLPNLFLRPATSCPRDMEDTECLLGGRRTYPRGSLNTFLLLCCRSAHLYRLEKFLYYYHGSSILCLRRQINWGTRTAFRNCTCYPLSTEYTLDNSRCTEVHRYRFEWQVHTDT